jgi:hypothetical protein
MAAAAGRAGLLGFGALGFVCLVGRAGEREAVDSCSAGDWLASSDGLCYECAGRGGAASMMVLLAIVVLTAAFVVGCWYVMQLLAGAEEREAEAQQQQLASGGMKKTRAAKMREDSGGAGSPTPLSDVLTGAKISIDHFQSLRFIAHCGVRWPSSTLAVWAPLAATVGLGVDLMVDLLMSTRLFVYLCYEQISLRTRTWVLFVPLVLTLLIARGYSARQRAAEVERVQQAQYEAEPTAGDDENVIDKAARSLRKKRENFESEDGDGAAAAELREQLSKESAGTASCVVLTVCLFGTLLALCLKPFDCVYVPKRLDLVYTCETTTVVECAAAAADQATCEAAGACTFTAGVAGATDGACVTATVAACAAAVADQATCEAAGTCTFNTTTAGTLEAWEYACTSVDECYIQKRAAGKAAFELHHGVRVVDDFELADRVACGELTEYISL